MNAKSYTPEEPIAAIATALAPAALGIIRTSGKNAVELVASVFSRPKALTAAAANTTVYGWIVDSNKQKIDEVVVAVYRAPKSFTGEDMAEIFCHGGNAVVLAVYNTLLAAGFRQAERGEYTFRAFLNGKADLTKAEAVREIIGAKTDESRSRAALRLEGSLHDEIQEVKNQLVHTMAAIEVSIEYPEDEATIATEFDSTELKAVRARLQMLADSWAAEKLYQEGAQVVLCGQTNAGKSSLFNTLLKEERAIVSDIRGTTRDWLESWASFDGIPARLFDTAGLRETEDIIEKAGVERTKDLSATADIILYVIDAASGADGEDKKFLSELDGSIPALVVLNKADKMSEPQKNAARTFAQSIAPLECIEVSAKTGSGTGELASHVKALLENSLPRTSGTAGLGSSRQKAAVEEALESVTHAFTVLKEGFTLDAVVQDIEDALASLGEITGEITPDDILESVFSSFCVGK